MAPQKVTFTCELEPGEPKAKIHWYKDAKEIYAGRKYEMSFVGTTAKLEINPTELSDTATYRVEAENKLARVDSQATLTVQGVFYLQCVTAVNHTCNIANTQTSLLLFCHTRPQYRITS